MDWSLNRRSYAALRIGLVVAIGVAAFWGIWSIFAPVPIVETVRLTPESVFTLPFPVSRWWDCLFVIPWTTLFVFVFTDRQMSKENVAFGVLGLVFGLGVGLALGLALGLGFSLVFGLLFSLFFSLGFGLVYGLGFSLVYGLGFSLVSGLVFGLVFGLIFFFKSGFLLARDKA